MNNFEYSYIIQELSPIIGKHFARMRKINENTYRMKIGNIEIICQLGVRLHKTKYMEETESANKFIQKIEKELDNAKLLSIEQINNDRIISFNFNRGNLIFEMFGKGNAILVQEGKIIAVHKSESWAGREIKLGEEYKPPKTKPADEIKITDKYIITSLLKLPLGKEYAQEALKRTSIDEKTPGNKLTKAEIKKIKDEIDKLRKNAKPNLFYTDEKPTDFSLTKLSTYSKSTCKEFESLSEVADEYYQNIEKPDERMQSLERRLEKQKERLKLLKEEEKNNKEKGDHVYANYTEIEELIKLAEKGKFKEIEEKYTGKINKKEKSIDIDL